MKRKYELFPLDLRRRTQSSERYCFRFFFTCFEREYCCCYLLFHHPPRRSSRHPYLRPHQRLIPHRGPAAEVHRRRQIVGGLPSERDTALLPVAWVMFSAACSVSTYTGRTPSTMTLLTTIFAKSRSFCVDFLTLKTLI